jgi:hypothetical protein
LQNQYDQRINDLASLNPLPKKAGNNTDKYMFSTKDFLQGDKVKLCLQALPTDCPKGDNRGKIYSVINYKNNKSFVGVDAWHLCGGA